MITPNSMKETIDRLNQELIDIRDALHAAETENNKLRTILADGHDPCIYCGLSKADMGKCASGFPGCARADDLLVKEGETKI